MLEKWIGEFEGLKKLNNSITRAEQQKRKSATA
jgi:hypothetical protein